MEQSPCPPKVESPFIQRRVVGENGEEKSERKDLLGKLNPIFVSGYR